MKKTKINPSEIEVLMVLWDANTAITVNEIVQAKPVLSKNTVSAVITSLLKKGLIEVDRIEMRGRSLARLFVPKVDKEELILIQYPEIDIENMLMRLLKKETSLSNLDHLQEIIEQEKNK